VPEHARLSLQERAVAVVESIAFLIQNNLEQIRKQQLITHLRVTGGLSKLSGLCQKLANLSGLDVSRVDDGEASARGVAWLASGQPAGWGEPGTAAQLFEPRPDSGLTERYRQFCAHLTNQLENPA
jgi:glycerol kinase